jgi:ABC-type spermidine/putrescine transport system permease subunit I
MGRRTGVTGWRLPRVFGKRFLLLLPLGAYLLFFYLLPVGSLLASSVLVEGKLTLAPFQELFRREDIVLTLVSSFEIAIVVTLLVLVIAYPIAHYMTILDGLLLAMAMALVVLPLLTSVMVRTYALTMFLSRVGVVNSVLAYFHIIREPLHLVYNRVGVYIGLIQLMLPFAVLPMYSTMKNIDVGLLKAASSLGASGWQVFRRIYLPLSFPGASSAVVLVFIGTLSAYVTPLIIGSERDGMIANVIAYEVQQSLDWPLAGALSFVLLVVSLGGLVAYLRLTTQKRDMTHV